MELIYLWVENYRNIKKQGFNFSPLHDFHFEVTNEEKDKVLAGQLIDKMPKYKREINSKLYDKFFEDNNIKVTAIIGENGSGKSSISEIFFSEEVYITVFKIEESIYVIHYHEQLSVSNLIALNDDKTQFKVITHKDYVKFFSSIKEEEKIDFIFYTDFYDETKKISNEGGRHDLSIKSRISNSLKKETHSFSLEEFFRKVELIDYFQKSSLEFPFALPDKVYLRLNVAGLQRIFPNNKTELNLPKNKNNSLKEINHLSKIGSKEEFFQKMQYVLYYCLFTNSAIQNLSIPTVSTFKDKLKLLNDILKQQEDIEKGNSIDIGIDTLKKYFEAIQEKGFIIEEEGKLVDMDELHTILTTLIKLLKVKTTWSESKKVLVLSFEDAFLIKKEIDKISFIVSPISFFWFKNEQSFHFSSGENAILRMLSSFYSIKHNIKLPNNLLFFIDEGELGMHPQWQKKYLNTLLNSLPKIFPSKYIQFILTSHSPFLASDLPRENIIFLEKNNDLCEIVDSSEKQQTFGQNIHTLLADSFFLYNDDDDERSGLMGEFAEQKIQSFINEIESSTRDNDRQTELQNKINLIGNDLLREVIQDLFDDKFNISIEDEETRLLRRLEELRKMKSDDDTNK